MEQPASARGRLLVALVAAIVLAGTVVAVVALGGSGNSAQSAAAASRECVRAWNGDPSATAYGRHNFNFHDYTGALVTFLTDGAEIVDADEGGVCAVIFPSRVLDPEPFAAGQVLRDGDWSSITTLEGVELTRVAELQNQAVRAPNTTLDTTGKLTAVQ